jgi:hypothetical protein
VGKPLGKWRSLAVPLAAAHIHVPAEITILDNLVATALQVPRLLWTNGRAGIAEPQHRAEAVWAEQPVTLPGFPHAAALSISVSNRKSFGR